LRNRNRSMRIGLISCAKTKRPVASKACDLYVSDLFKGLLKYSERHCDVSYILSAKHGLLELDTVIDPYDKTLLTMSKQDRLRWAYSVDASLAKVVRKGDTVVLLAGEKYREFLEPLLRNRGCYVEVPFRGYKLGEQL